MCPNIERRKRLTLHDDELVAEANVYGGRADLYTRLEQGRHHESLGKRLLLKSSADSLGAERATAGYLAPPGGHHLRTALPSVLHGYVRQLDGLQGEPIAAGAALKAPQSRRGERVDTRGYLV